MSRRAQSTQAENQTPLGAWLRQLRCARKLPLRTVAAAAEMDSTLLSKVELGQRLPTETQTAALARFFAVPTEELQARRIVVDFCARYGDGESAHKAIAIIYSAVSRRGKRNAD